MAENGEEKLFAVARHIAKTLGNNETMADDILQIFSNFDGRFSREKLSEKVMAAATEDGIGIGDSRASSALDHVLTSLGRQISRYEAADQPIWSDSADSAAFLDTIDELLATVREWSHSGAAGDRAVAACLSRADDLVQRAMFRLEDEFRSLMERGGESLAALSADSDTDEDDENGGADEEEIPTARPLGEYDVVIDALPSGTIGELHEMAKRMVAAGFGKECCHVYSSCRREFLEESLSRLGLRKLSTEEVQRTPWQELEDEIERWTKALGVSLRILFPSERRLCDRVFFGLSSAADLSFMEVCRSSAIQLLNFADAVAIGTRSPERLFKILDVFESLRDLMPEIDAVFSDQYSSPLRNEATTIWKRLGDAVRGIFMELENLISRDPAKTGVPGGGLHPITRYVMNYLRAASRSRHSLEQIFEDGSGGGGPASALSVQVAWIMELLERNLEAKSKVYKDPSLCSVFLMNNGRYIVQKARDGELGSLLGDDWVRKHTAKLRQCHGNYQRSTWNKLVGLLKPDPARPMKDKLKNFYQSFDEVCKVQSAWVVFDDQLRAELKISITELVLPAYQSFLGRFQSSLEIGRNAERYVKYDAEDIEARIEGLFQGSGGGSSGGRR